MAACNLGIYNVALLVTLWTFTCCFVGGAETSDRISCYNCTTTKHGKDCDDPVDPNKLRKFMSECEPGLDVCAKILTVGKEPIGIQSESEYLHTTRLCSRKRSTGCEELDGKGTLTSECWCKGHLCNAAGRTLMSPVTWLLTAVAAILSVQARV